MMDEYFKIERAQEEIDQLNVEIRCLVTYLRNEEVYLQEREKTISEKDTPLAHQIFLHFTGSLTPSIQAKEGNERRHNNMEVDDSGDAGNAVGSEDKDGGTDD
ncbi:hypothetical protein C0993_000591, partial [Termitomyces sp. T159_Od127]